MKKLFLTFIAGSALLYQANSAGMESAEEPVYGRTPVFQPVYGRTPALQSDAKTPSLYPSSSSPESYYDEIPTVPYNPSLDRSPNPNKLSYKPSQSSLAMLRGVELRPLGIVNKTGHKITIIVSTKTMKKKNLFKRVPEKENEYPLKNEGLRILQTDPDMPLPLNLVVIHGSNKKYKIGEFDIFDESHNLSTVMYDAHGKLTVLSQKIDDNDFGKLSQALKTLRRITAVVMILKKSRAP